MAVPKKKKSTSFTRIHRYADYALNKKNRLSYIKILHNKIKNKSMRMDMIKISDKVYNKI